MESEIPKGEKVIWMHCASLGEFEQGRPVIEGIKSEFPDVKLLLTFFSPSGYIHRKEYPLADYVFYLPADLPGKVTRFLDLANPLLAIFVKYEFWPNFLNGIKDRNIPLVLISASFRKDQVFFKWYGPFFRNMLSKFDHIFVQDIPSRELLKGIKISSDCIGDTRLDRVEKIRSEKKEFELVQKFKGDQSLFVCGSTWPKDEKLIQHLAQQPFSNGWKFLIAPHSISTSHVEEILQLFGKEAVLYSNAEKDGFSGKRFLIIDHIGSLAYLYKYGSVAYIGGGFGSGIHNTLEAAVYRIPLIFGPNYHSFPEASELVETGAGFCIKDSLSLEQAFEFLKNSENYQLTVRSVEKYFKERGGASDKILSHLKNMPALNF